MCILQLLSDSFPGQEDRSLVALSTLISWSRRGNRPNKKRRGEHIQCYVDAMFGPEESQSRGGCRMSPKVDWDQGENEVVAAATEP